MITLNATELSRPATGPRPLPVHSANVDPEGCRCIRESGEPQLPPLTPLVSRRRDDIEHSSAPSEPLGVVVLLGQHRGVAAGEHGPPGHDAVRASQRTTTQRVVDAPTNFVGPFGFGGEKDSDVHDIADAVGTGVVRRQRAGWLVIPASAQRDRDRPAG